MIRLRRRAGTRICKIAVFDKEDAAKNCASVLEPFRKNSGGRSGRKKLDRRVNPVVNKGAALAKIQRQWGISRAETMAFGDYLNDCEMMECSAFSYAMANAHGELKKLCRLMRPPTMKMASCAFYMKNSGSIFSKEP